MDGRMIFFETARHVTVYVESNSAMYVATTPLGMIAMHCTYSNAEVGETKEITRG